MKRDLLIIEDEKSGRIKIISKSLKTNCIISYLEFAKLSAEHLLTKKPMTELIINWTKKC